MVQYIQFVLQIFQIYCNFGSAQCVLCKGTVSPTVWALPAHGGGQTEFCILSPAYLSLSLVFSICSIYSIWCNPQILPLFLKFLFHSQKKGKMFLLRKTKFLCRSTLSPTALLLYVQHKTMQQTLAVSTGIIKLTNSSSKELLAKFTSPKLASHFLFPSKHAHTWKQEVMAHCSPHLNQHPSWSSQCLSSFFYILHFAATILLVCVVFSK